MYRGDWTEALAQLFPEREAVLEVRTGERVTYTQLHRRVAATAAALVELGAKRGDRIAILAKNRLEHIDLLFACARLGCMYVPLNWRLAEPELAFLLDDAEPAVLFYERAFASEALRLAAARPVRALPIAADDVVLDEGAAAAGARHLQALRAAGGRTAPPPQADVSLDDPWIILYTSGTTGHPKGALLPYRQVAFNALNTIVALDLTSADRTVTYTPLFHTGGLHVLTTPMLAKGASIVLCDGFDADKLIDLHETERCTILFGVPTTFEMLAEHPRFADGDLSAVRVALCGGAPCPLSLIERYTRRGIVFKQGYGLTEVGPNVLNLNPEDVVKKAGFAGRPNLTVTARLVDAAGHVVLGAGRGELVLGGPCVCLGYWRRAEATAAAFTADGFFRTGDIVERDADGYCAIVDRAKDMYISGGENVYPAEVEKALADHPGVRQAAVVGIPDPKWGEVGRAFVELAHGQSSVDTAELTAFLRERVAKYKVPKEFVVVDELPKNPSGKVQKHLLSRGPA